MVATHVAAVGLMWSDCSPACRWVQATALASASAEVAAVGPTLPLPPSPLRFMLPDRAPLPGATAETRPDGCRIPAKSLAVARFRRRSAPVLRIVLPNRY